MEDETKMSDNVLILGAGASHDAGIPLLAGFVDKMLDFTLRGKADGVPLDEHSLKIFQRAYEIRKELDGYHGRAAFDDRNIEDILSILAFNAMGGAKKDKEKLAWIEDAIVKTIELSCTVKENHDGKSRVPGDVYQHLWYYLLKWCKDKNSKFPSIITFNYDLVLERSLFHLLDNVVYNLTNNPIPFQEIRLEYHYTHLPFREYKIDYREHVRANERPMPGTSYQEIEVQNPLHIDLLKMHGSLNFPRRPVTDLQIPITRPVESPYILPPIFDKLKSSGAEGIWKCALGILRKAKNIVFVGYSLPRTDIYMQYFLKSALGPNIDLNRIFVFDPVLFKDGPENQEMRNRYSSCFAPQLVGRIVFDPPTIRDSPPVSGSLHHFMSLFTRKDQGILF